MAGSRDSTRAERGASILELAFITPIMALLVMGVLDVALAYRMQIRLENAAREGSAHAVLNPNDVDCPVGMDITDRIIGEDDVDDLPSFAITVLAEDFGGEPVVPVTGCGGTEAQPDERVRVEVAATYDVLTPLVERAVGSSIRLTGSSEIEVQG